MTTRSLVRLELVDGPGPEPQNAVRIRRSGRTWLERLLFAIAAACLGYYSYVFAEARLYQSFENKELDTILASGGTSSTPAVARRPAPAPGSTIGRVEIPRLGVAAVIRAGSDARTLRLAVGYIPGTALPGERGNVGLAGHRDTFFRKLHDINPGDEIRVTTKDGVFHYFVQRTSIVEPRDVWVLDPTASPALTLVTCYPFSYIGSAPQRFIVRAALRVVPTTLKTPVSPDESRGDVTTAPRLTQRRSTAITQGSSSSVRRSIRSPAVRRKPRLRRAAADRKLAHNVELRPQLLRPRGESGDLQPERRQR
jgi:sortase A